MRYLTGFDCISKVDGDGFDRYPVAAATTITKGDAVDTAANTGYAAGLSLFTKGFAGIATETEITLLVQQGIYIPKLYRQQQDYVLAFQ